MRFFGLVVVGAMISTTSGAMAVEANGSWMCKRADNYIVAALNITDEKYIVINNLGPSGDGKLTLAADGMSFVPKNGTLKAAMHITTGTLTEAGGKAVLDLLDRAGAHLTCSKG